jgi:predicted amidohydrolase
MKVALWQGRSPAGDLEAAVDEAARAAHAAVAAGAAVVVLPEVWLPGYNQPDIATRALSSGAQALTALADVAADAGITVVAGYAERAEDRLWNAAVAFGPDGKEAARYRKVQLYGPREKAMYTPGSAYVTFALGPVTGGLLICYDVEFDVHVAALAARGAEVLLVPTANMVPFDHVVRHTVPAQAANHGVTIVYANYCGAEGDLTYVGGSLIAGPHGEVLAQAGSTPALLVAEVPLRDPVRLSTQATDRVMLP